MANWQEKEGAGFPLLDESTRTPVPEKAPVVRRQPVIEVEDRPLVADFSATPTEHGYGHGV